MSNLQLVSSDFSVLKEIDLRIKSMGLNGVLNTLFMECFITKTLTRKSDAIHILRDLKCNLEILIEEFE